MKPFLAVGPVALSAVGFLFASAAFAAQTSQDAPHKAHAVPASAKAELEMMDSDKDGKVSMSEHTTGAKAMFNSLDANKDSKVTAAEMDAAQRSTTRPGEKEAAGMSSAEKIQVIDTDGDGMLTAEEHEAGAKKVFTAMDVNKDNLLTIAELEAGRKTMLSSK